MGSVVAILPEKAPVVPKRSRGRGYSAIGLHMPKTPANVGSVMRAAGCFGVSLVAMAGHRYQGAPTDPAKNHLHMPFLRVENLRDAIPHDCIPVAVDLLDGARSLVSYTHPERAFYIFGPEDGTLPESVVSWCRDKVYIPTDGCLNLAAACNVVLYDRAAKLGRGRHVL
jgi:tRNA(Leu) C34 or U34 (ribose-2'-O)-methylase TrmL